MKEISSGAQKWEGEKCYLELSDKRMYCNLFFLVNQIVYLGTTPQG